MVNENTPIGYIYGLYSTSNNQIRYIGYTIKPKERFKDHIKESKRLLYYRHKWIQSELKKDNKIEMKILKICKEEDLGKYEIEQIKIYKDLGYKLTNGNNGGLGGINPTAEVRKKLRISKLGNKYAIGVKKSLENRLVISKRMKERIVSFETKEKLRIANLGKKSPNLLLRIIKDDVIIELYRLFNSKKTVTEISNILYINSSTIKNVLYRKEYYYEIKEKHNLFIDRK